MLDAIQQVHYMDKGMMVEFAAVEVGEKEYVFMEF